jgi:phosphatidylserine decarboxylase
VILVLIVYFFRDPPRKIPVGPALMLAPADGKVVEISRLEHDDFVGGPAVRIGIFLTIFNVHINRAPCRARVIALRYSTGRFMNALDPASLIHNENMWIALEAEEAPHRRLVVRQIAGAIARRIVCDLRPGRVVEAGEKFGMIKLGSRTELIMPDEEGLEIDVRVGQWINAGKQIVARYRSADSQ